MYIVFKFVPFEVFQWNYNDQVEELVVIVLRLKGKDLCESFKELLFVFQSNAAESELLSILSTFLPLKPICTFHKCLDA